MGQDWRRGKNSPVLVEGQEVKKRTCRDWTEQDTARTITLLAEGKSLNEIGRILGRSGHTVRANMAKHPGYKPRPVGRPIGNVCQKVEVKQTKPTIPVDDRGLWDTTLSSRMLSMPMRISQ